MVLRVSASCQKNVKQKSNDCAAVRSTHDDFILNNIRVCETFSTPNKEVARGKGYRAVSGTTIGRSTIASSSQCIQKTLVGTCNFASKRGFCEWIYIIQMLIQSRQKKRKSRKSHDSQINHARSQIIKFRNENQSQCVLCTKKKLFFLDFVRF